MPAAISLEMQSLFSLHGQGRRRCSPKADGRKRKGIVKTSDVEGGVLGRRARGKCQGHKLPSLCLRSEGGSVVGLLLWAGVQVGTDARLFIPEVSH